MSPAALLRIMYSPLDYAHADYRTIADIDLRGLPPSVANQLLLDHYGFSNKIDFGLDLDRDAQVRECLNHWARLPRIGYLMGVQLLRTALLECGAYPRLDAVSKRFLCLPLSGLPHASLVEKLDDPTIAITGVDAISSVLRRFAPALRERLPLLFPQALRGRFDKLLTEAHCPPGRDSYYPSLFFFAVNYALFDSSTAAR